MLPLCSAVRNGTAAINDGLCRLCPKVRSPLRSSARPAGRHCLSSMVCLLCDIAVSSQDQYRYGLGEECRPCPASAGLQLQQTVGILWFGAGLCYIAWSQVSRRSSTGVTTHPGRTAAQVLPIVLGHTQLLSVLLVVPWDYPPWVLGVMELPAAFLGFDLLAMFQVDCSLGHSREVCALYLPCSDSV